MVDILKKASLFTAEILSLTADKVQEVADDFVKKGTLHDNEAKKFVSEVRSTLENREKELTEKWELLVNSVQQIGNTLGIQPKSQEENVENRIEDLEKQLEELKARRDVMSKEHKKEAANPAKAPKSSI